MSYKTEQYSRYSTYFVEVDCQGVQWDKQVHIHTQEELFLFLNEGSCTVINNGVTRTIPTPAFLWNRAGSYHLVLPPQGSRISYLLTFYPQILEDVPKKLQYTDFMQDHGLFALPLDAARARRLERLILLILESPFPQRQLLLPCLFHQVEQYQKTGPAPICTGTTSGYIYQVLELLEQSPEEKLTTEQLAQRFHVGKTKLKADFKKLTGVTLHAFRLQIQLQTARLLMASTDQTLAQIASQCGFADESHLIRSFQKQYGVTPGTHRRLYHNNPRWK